MPRADMGTKTEITVKCLTYDKSIKNWLSIMTVYYYYKLNNITNKSRLLWMAQRIKLSLASICRH